VRNISALTRLGQLIRSKPAIVEFTGLALVIMVGAYLRLANLDFAQFNADDVALLGAVKAEIARPVVVTSGMPSASGLPHGPLPVYLLIPGILLAPGPIGAYLTVAVLNILAILLFWGFVRSYWGANLALVAALFFATSPWAVVLSRRLWGNDMMAPFTVLLVWSVCDFVTRGRKRDSFLPFLWLAIVIQLYVGAFVHLGSAAAGLILGFRRLRVKYAVAGSVVFAGLVAPYVIWAVVPYLGRLQTYLGYAAQDTGFDFASLLLLFGLVSSDGYQSFTGQAQRIVDAGSGLPALVSYITQAFLVIGLAKAGIEAVRAWRHKAFSRATPYIVPLVAVTLPSLSLLRHTGVVDTNRVGAGLPMHFLFIAIGAFSFYGAVQSLLGNISKGRPWRWIPPIATSSLMVCIVATHFVLAQAYYTAIKGYWANSNYGLPLRLGSQISETARRIMDREGITTLYLGGAEIHDDLVFVALNQEIPGARTFGSTDSFVIPDTRAGKALYIVSSADDNTGKLLNERPAGSRLAEVEWPGDGVRFSFYSAPASLFSDVSCESKHPVKSVTFDDRIRLDGWVVDSALRPGGQVKLILCWSVVSGEAAPEYYVYLRLIDNSDRVRLAVKLNDVSQWHSGERWIWWRNLKLPVDLEPGVYSILIGAYAPDTSASYRNARAVVEAGESAGGMALLGRGAVRTEGVPVPPYPVSYTFGDVINLEGYGLPGLDPGKVVKPGSDLSVDLYWRAANTPDRDYTVFVHFTGPDSAPLAQHDSQPDNGRYPTSFWPPGDTVLDRHRLAIPPGVPPGQYFLRVGMYDAATNQRLGGPAAVATIPMAVQ
jgi:hypothetical protein